MRYHSLYCSRAITDVTMTRTYNGILDIPRIFRACANSEYQALSPLAGGPGYKARSKPVHTCIDCINRFEPLSKQADSSCRDDHIDSLHVDVNLVQRKVKALGGNKRERRLSVATWNFSGLGSECKQKEVGELLTKNNLDVVAGQESWEREDTLRLVREGREGLAF